MPIICPVCGHTLDSSWPECPYCHPMAIKSSNNFTPNGNLEKVNNVKNEEYQPESKSKKIKDQRRTIIKDSFRSVGYTISQDDTEIPLMGWIVVIKGNNVGESYPLMKERIVIGADSEKCDIVINDDMVSSEHCAIRITPGSIIHINDLGSRNGTIINNEKSDGNDLVDNDRIKIGKTILVFKSFDSSLFDL